MSIVFFDAQGRYRLINDNAIRGLGAAQEQIIGKRIKDVLGDGYIGASFQRNLDMALRGELISMTDKTYIPWMEQERTFYALFSPHYGEDGAVEGVIFLALDITEQVSAQERLQTSQERLRYALEGSNDGLWDWNVSAGEVYFSPRWMEMLGYEPYSLPMLAATFFDLVHPDDHERVGAQIEAHLSGTAQTPYEVEVRMRTRQGAWKWILTRGRVTARDDNGRAVRMVGTHVDLTERKRAEAELQTSQERLRYALEGSNDGLWDWNIVTGEVYFSPRWVGMLGYEPGELPGRVETMMRLTHPDDSPEVGRRIEAHLAGVGQEIFEAELRARMKDGGWKWVLTRGRVTVRDAEGRPMRMAGTHVDLTERKRAEAELQRAKEQAEQASHAKSEFLANVSHELRTPMNGILGYTQILLKDASLTSTQRDRLKIIQRSGDHLMRLINEVLDLSRIEAQRMELVPEAFDLMDLIDSLVALCRVRAEQRNVALLVEFDAAARRGVWGDEQRLRQVLLNLITNAIKFTERGRVLFRVTEELAESRVRFEVQDTGVGIAPEALELIFEPFRQLGRASTKGEGSGLGLAISRQLVRLMGGELHVRSVPGEGSTFWFDLPLPEASPEPVSHDEAISLLGYTGERERALVVDDHQINRAVLTELLEPLGFEVYQASDGEEALALVEALRPRVVFMDLRMPRMNGLEAIEAIRGMALQPEPVLITVSASAMGSNPKDALAAGADVFLTKPLHPRQLHQALTEHVPLRWLRAHELADEALPDRARASEGPPRPPEPVLRDLESLVLSGDVEGIVAWSHARVETGEWPIFAAQVEQLARSFQFYALRQLIAADTPAADA